MIRIATPILLAVTPLLFAQDPADQFVSRVYPVLKANCFGCHGDGQTLAKLDLRTREILLKGGTRGPAIIPGDASKSLLSKALIADGLVQMPPEMRQSAFLAKRSTQSAVGSMRERDGRRQSRRPGPAL